MCMGIPMEIIEVDGSTAVCRSCLCDSSLDFEAQLEKIDLSLVGSVPKGGYVLTFIGRATEILDSASAQRITNALKAVDLARHGQSFDHLLGDLINREPELPSHLRPTPQGDTA